MSTSLQQQQEALVAALVLNAEAPPGFDSARVKVASRALLRKRAGEVGEAWPLFRHAMGERWLPEFRRWATGRAKLSSFDDGFAFASHLRDGGQFPVIAESEFQSALRVRSQPGRSWRNPLGLGRLGRGLLGRARSGR